MAFFDEFDGKFDGDLTVEFLLSQGFTCVSDTNTLNAVWIKSTNIRVWYRTLSPDRLSEYETGVRTLVNSTYGKYNLWVLPGKHMWIGIGLNKKVAEYSERFENPSKSLISAVDTITAIAHKNVGLHDVISIELA
jgi:hypothetical protein